LVRNKRKAVGQLAFILEWNRNPTNYDNLTAESDNIPAMQAVIARGSPYTSMSYFNATPLIYMQQQSLKYAPLVDGQPNTTATLYCGQGPGKFSAKPVAVKRYLQVQLVPSDMTWLIFFSEPVEVVCSEHLDRDVPSTKSFFELRTVRPLKQGMVRVALVNNCTTGTNVRCKSISCWSMSVCLIVKFVFYHFLFDSRLRGQKKA